MDGVLVDWLGGVAELLDIKLDDKAKSILKKGKKLTEATGVPTSEIWKAINNAGHTWWANLNPLPWADDLLKHCKSVGDICVLSSPGDHDVLQQQVSCAGKVEYLDKHLNGIPYMLSSSKQYAASGGSILIDDDTKKCQAFDDFGGSAFLWPNQYKLLDGDITFKSVVLQLSRTFNI